MPGWTASQHLRIVRRAAATRRPFKLNRSFTHTPLYFQRYANTRATAAGGSNYMRTRRVSQAVLAGAVAATAWYAYKGSGSVTRLDYGTTAASQNTPPARQALIVEQQGSLYTTEIPPGQPVSKTDEHGRQVLEMLTPDQVTEKLRKTEESYFVRRGKGVVRYDLVSVPSNNPIEDDHVEKVIEIPSPDGNSDWMFWGVFDGHVGWTTSAKLRQTLVSYVARELNATYTAARNNPSSINHFPSSASIDDAIKTAFNRLDHDIVHKSVDKVLAAKSKPLAVELLAPAISGACALLSFYDSRSKELRVACAGDSRAVLGRRAPNGKWTATALSVDQTAGTPFETKRLQTEHPDEPMVAAHGRVLGSLEPSRTFGDAGYKWAVELQEKLHRDYFGRRPNRYLKTPPYVTAEPIVTTTKIQPETDDFVVMATDGLWEMLTNEEVVGLVGMWLERQDRTKAAVGSPSTSSWVPSWLGGSSNLLPVQGEHGSETGSGQRAPIRRDQWGVTGSESDRFVVEDKNVATHLVRNAMGGRDKNMLSALLTLTSPNARRYRDDVTIEVIFFARQDGLQVESDKVELNKEASTGATLEHVRPKL